MVRIDHGIDLRVGKKCVCSCGIQSTNCGVLYVDYVAVFRRSVHRHVCDDGTAAVFICDSGLPLVGLQLSGLSRVPAKSMVLCRVPSSYVITDLYSVENYAAELLAGRYSLARDFLSLRRVAIKPRLR